MHQALKVHFSGVVAVEEQARAQQVVRTVYIVDCSLLSRWYCCQLKQEEAIEVLASDVRSQLQPVQLVLVWAAGSQV